MIEFHVVSAKRRAKCLRQDGTECCRIIKGEKAVLMITYDGSGTSAKQVCLNEGLRLIKNQLKVKDKKRLDKLIIDAELKRLLKEKGIGSMREVANC